MAEKFEPGDRVRGFWDLATVLEVLNDGGVRVQFDEVDATGMRIAPHLCEPVIRQPETLIKVPQDTPMADERFVSPRPPGLTDAEWSEFQRGGGTIRHGRDFEDGSFVHEIRWPNGAVTDLLDTTRLGPRPEPHYATGGYVSGPKPGDSPLVPDGCTLWLQPPMLTPSNAIVQVNTDVRSIYADTSPTGYEQLLQQIGKMLPPEPIKLTREQLEQARAVLGETTSVAPSLLSVPIEIVDCVEDSTPYQQRREKLKAAFEAAMRIPYPQIESGSEP